MAKDAPLSKVAESETHGENSPYFAGWKAYEEDPYHEVSNPGGVIQMGLAENQISFNLLEDYLEEHSESSAWGRGLPDSGRTHCFKITTGFSPSGR
ncbi:hypothetical protein MLD38_014301 [Melastoma candidum]|uniref:Uncharacterized protein n=1 Tax=Melastoma candidum TaxID=119954 RepID=A0ACB9RDI6_9MYRT|nr:hypothetical protein MLD38_014301 [Melastoma candidum]